MALRLLARREHSRAELRRKLLARGHDPDLVAGVLDALAAEGLQNEARFAAEYARARAAKGFGPLRIAGELRERGVEAGLAEEAAWAAAEDWGGRARAVRARRFGPQAPGAGKERARQLRFLEHRGFSAEQIASALGALQAP